MCLYPKMIRNKKYTETKKNEGVVPLVYDNRALAVPIGCGNCIECRKQKARGWMVRLMEDIRHHTGGKFVTLTFSTKSLIELSKEKINRTDRRTGEVREYIIDELEGYDRDNMMATKGMRFFLERWRKEYGKSLRHWCITELGHKGTEHIHIHGIVWCTKDQLKELPRIWHYGYVWKGTKINDIETNYVNEATVNYIVKYISKVDMIHQKFQGKVLASAGIGRDYVARENKFNFEETREYYRTRTGHKIAMPKYWRNKIYSDEEREALWMNLLDKEVRYVRGEKIDVSKGLKDYFETVDWHRKINRQLGYGSSEKRWNREVYERERRNAIWEQRKRGAIDSDIEWVET